MGGLLLILSLSILESVPHHLKITIEEQLLVLSFYTVLQIFLQLKQKEMIFGVPASLCVSLSHRWQK